MIIPAHGLINLGLTRLVVDRDKPKSYGWWWWGGGWPMRF